MPFVRYTVMTFAGTIPWCFGSPASASRSAVAGRFHASFRYADYAILALIVVGAATIATGGTGRGRNQPVEERSAEDRRLDSKAFPARGHSPHDHSARRRQGPARRLCSTS